MVVELLECVMCYISVFFIITGLPQANPWPTPKASGATLNSEMLNVIAHGRHGVMVTFVGLQELSELIRAASVSKLRRMVAETRIHVSHSLSTPVFHSCFINSIFH
jgi:hypothetical protein